MEIESIKKAQSDGIVEMKNLENWTWTTQVGFTNIIQKMEEIISGIEVTVENTYTMVREDVKSKILTQNLQESRTL